MKKLIEIIMIIGFNNDSNNKTYNNNSKYKFLNFKTFYVLNTFRLSLIYSKFDEVARSGNMVVEEDGK